jgi:hypothetical protein
MHRDFDAERAAKPNLTFDLAGHRFRVKREVAPEALDVFVQFREAEDNLTSVKLMDEAIKTCLWPEDHAGWNELRKIRGEGEVGTDTIVAVMDYILEVVTGRPTSPSLPSANGSPPAATGTTSTVESSSQEELVSPV